MRKQLAAFVLASLVFVGLAYPQTLVKSDQGRPGNQGPWPVTGTFSSVGPDGGAVIIQELSCTGAVETVLVFDGGDASRCPTFPLAGRRTVTLCSSPKNTGTPYWTIRADSVWPTTAAGSAGQVLGNGDCVMYVMGSAVGIDAGVGANLNCIADTSNAILTMTECK